MSTCRLTFEKSCVSKMRTCWLTFKKSMHLKYMYIRFSNLSLFILGQFWVHNVLKNKRFCLRNKNPVLTVYENKICSVISNGNNAILSLDTPLLHLTKRVTFFRFSWLFSNSFLLFKEILRKINNVFIYYTYIFIYLFIYF